MKSSGKIVIDLQSGVYELLETASDYVLAKVRANEIVHLIDQPEYPRLRLASQGTATSMDRFLFYRSCPAEIDNDVSMASFSVFLSLYPFLDASTLRRQYWHDGERWVTTVYDKKFACSSFPACVLGNARASAHDYTGDTITSLWTPLREHLNRSLAKGLAEGRLESVELAEMLGDDHITGSAVIDALYLSADGNRLVELLSAHVSDSCMEALDLSDTIGNMMLCASGCNTSRQDFGAHDTAEYFLAHVWKYYENGHDVRFLNRLFAKVGRKRYVEYKSIDDVPTDMVYATQYFVSMLERSGCDTWVDFVDAFCFRSFTTDDERHVPLSMITGNKIEWGGAEPYDDRPKTLEQDDAMFSNLALCLRKRNQEVAEKLIDFIAGGLT